MVGRVASDNYAHDAISNSPYPLIAWCIHQFSQALQDGCPILQHISQSEGCITRGAAEGDTALWLQDISCIILQNSW